MSCKNISLQEFSIHPSKISLGHREDFPKMFSSLKRSFPFILLPQLAITGMPSEHVAKVCVGNVAECLITMQGPGRIIPCIVMRHSDNVAECLITMQGPGRIIWQRRRMPVHHGSGPG